MGRASDILIGIRGANRPRVQASKGNSSMSNTAPAIRDLSASELADISGGAINVDFELYGVRFRFVGGDNWQSGCFADGDSFGCTTVAPAVYTSSGPLPK
jgi:hypothetical protein